MLLLNSSEHGLKRSLKIVHDYCDTWQLVVNINKTKITIFNKIKINCTFEYRGTKLEIAHQYTHLGLNIHKTGSYIKTIEDFTIKTQWAYYKLKSTLSNTQVPPRLYLKIM